MACPSKPFQKLAFHSECESALLKRDFGEMLIRKFFVHSEHNVIMLICSSGFFFPISIVLSRDGQWDRIARMPFLCFVKYSVGFFVRAILFYSPSWIVADSDALAGVRFGSSRPPPIPERAAVGAAQGTGPVHCRSSPAGRPAFLPFSLVLNTIRISQNSTCVCYLPSLVRFTGFSRSFHSAFV